MSRFHTTCWACVLLLLLSCTSNSARAKTPALIRHGVGDVKFTVASWPALVILGGAATAGIVSQFDHSWQHHFDGGGTLGKLDSIADFIGQPYVLDPAALAIWGAGKLSHHDKLALTGETLLEALLFTDAATQGLKWAFRRERPNGGGHSFPSGHASTTFAVATVLEVLYGPKAGLPAYVVAGLISFTRIDSNAHFASDVLFGAALGSAIGWGTAYFHKRENPRFFVTPAVAGAYGLNAFYSF